MYLLAIGVKPSFNLAGENNLATFIPQAMPPLCLLSSFNLLPVRSWLDTNHYHFITESSKSNFFFHSLKELQQYHASMWQHKTFMDNHIKNFNWILLCKMLTK